MTTDLTTQYTVTINGHHLHHQDTSASPFEVIFGHAERRVMVFDTEVGEVQHYADCVRAALSRQFGFGLTPIVAVARRYCTDWMFGDPATTRVDRRAVARRTVAERWRSMSTTDATTREAIRVRAREIAAQAPTGWSPEQTAILRRIVLPHLREEKGRAAS